jgi:hypothetical protein
MGNNNRHSKLNHPVVIRFAEREYELLHQWAFADRKAISAIVRNIVEEKLKGMGKVLTNAVIASTVRVSDSLKESG